MSDYTMLHKYGKCVRQLKIKTKLKETYKTSLLWDVLNETIIPRALAGYSQLGYQSSHIQRSLVE